MYKLAFLFSMFLALNVSALETNTQFNFECKTGNIEECLLLKLLFLDSLKENNVLDIASIELIEIEEEVEINFDTKKYLPIGFNALKGKHDLDWSKIEIVEIEEEVEINFDTKKYLPAGFNAFKVKDDLGQTIVNMVIIKIEKELGYKITKTTYCSL